MHPPPSHHTCIEDVKKWRELSKDEQHQIWQEYMALPIKDREPFDYQVPTIGDYPSLSERYRYNPNIRKVPEDQRKRKRGTAPTSSSNSEDEDDDSEDANNTTENETPSSTVENETPPPPPPPLPAKPIKSRRNSTQQPTTISQMNDVTAQRNFNSLYAEFCKFVQSTTPTHENDHIPGNKDLFNIAEPITGATLIIHTRAKPTESVGGRPSKKKEKLLMENPKYHVLCSDKTVLREHSKALLASYEHINHPELRNPRTMDMRADTFNFTFPEQATTNRNHMMESALQRKEEHRRERAAPTHSIIDSQGTTTSRMIELGTYVGDIEE